MVTGRYARVIVEVAPPHLDRPFDYRIPDGLDVRLGQRVRVVFSGRRRTGWIVGKGVETDADPGRIRELSLIQGTRTWFDAADLSLFRWAAERYAGTLADVLRHAMPARVASVDDEASSWLPPPDWSPAVDQLPVENHRAAEPEPWRPYQASALLRAIAVRAVDGPPPVFWWRPLPGDDRAAMAADLVARCVASGRRALVLAPDPASQMFDAALSVGGAHGADLRAATSQRARYRAFLRCRDGHARVAVGERGAAFTPLPDLGLVVVDDEANPAYKERRSPRHHAREVALTRARMAGAVTVLLSDLPSAQLWRLIGAGHVSTVAADRASERRRAPRVDVIDRSRSAGARTRFAAETASALSSVVRSGGVSVVLASRRGQGAALACRGCGWRLACPVCAGSLRPQRDRPGRADAGTGERAHAESGWDCPSCGWSGAPFACPVCGDERSVPLAAGAGRLATELRRSHPGVTVAQMEGFDAPGPSGRPAIGVLTRGSVVARPAWLAGQRADLVVVPDADAMLHRAALDAGEDALRLWMGAASWTVAPLGAFADVSDRERTQHGMESGKVMLQTREPGNAAVQALVRWDAEGYWRQEAGRRAELGYPPARSLVRLTVRSQDLPPVIDGLRERLPASDDVLGPDPDGVILVKSLELRGTLASLRRLRKHWSQAGYRVQVDVDPIRP